mmetsp:Transcript_77796/g.224923  ORF Transcript_77796/g.224923 Transcript_77796/m.224923 type:complete len:355 (+) Transcript_77796:992-2056(+)
MNPRPAKRILLNVFEQQIPLFGIAGGDLQSGVAEVMVELQVDHSHVHDDHLLQVFVFQHRPQHRIRLVELQTDRAMGPGGTSLGSWPAHRLRIYSVGCRVHRPSGGRCHAACIGHAAVHDLLHFHYDSMHLRRLRITLNNITLALGRSQVRATIDDVGCEIHSQDIDGCRAKQCSALIPRDGFIKQEHVKQHDGQRIEKHVACERHPLQLQRNHRGRDGSAADDDEHIEDLGAHHDPDAGVGACVQGDEICEEFGPVATERAYGRASDCLLAPPLHILVLAFPHLFHENIDGRNEIRVTNMVLREEHEGDQNKPEQAHAHVRLHGSRPQRAKSGSKLPAQDTGARRPSSGAVFI